MNKLECLKAVIGDNISVAVGWGMAHLGCLLEGFLGADEMI